MWELCEKRELKRMKKIVCDIYIYRLRVKEAEKIGAVMKNDGNVAERLMIDLICL